MGCCLSSNNKKPNPQKHQNHFQESQNNNRSPPPTLVEEVEEEKVKQVLSETPIMKPLNEDQNQIQPNKENNTQIPKHEEHPKDESFIKKEDKKTPEISQASEVYTVSNVSVSESLSISGISAQTVQEDEVISSGNTAQVGVKRVAANRTAGRVQKKRPLSGEIVRERRVAKSPARRAEPSPEKRRAMRQSRAVGASSSRGGVVRRDVAGELSGRRSRSPAMRGGARRVRGNEVGRKEDLGGVESCGNVEKDEVSVKDENGQQQQQGEGNESIENPHVQLECFIFL